MMNGTNDFSLSDIAAATGGNGFGNGDNWILIILFAMIFGWGNGGFGNRGNDRAATEGDVQRAVDLSAVLGSQRELAADIQRTNYEQIGATKDASYNNLSEIRDVEAAITGGNANIINMLTAMMGKQQECCCDTKQMIMENRYLDEKHSYDVKDAVKDGIQKITELIGRNRMEDMQSQINQLNMQLAMCGVVRYPTATTYTSGNNPFCNYGAGC